VDTVTLFLGNLLQSIEEGNFNLGIFIDLSKAFDTINHNILLDKLYRLGIRGIANDWLKSYLSNRQQTVRMYSENSNSFTLSDQNEINTGVPQGSVLGPLLFIIYITDMNKCLTNSTAFGFADDTTLLVKNKEFEDLYINAYEDLENICDWFAANKLSINLSKTNYILFRNKTRIRQNNIPNLIINGIEICKVDSTKFLGIVFDSNLNWSNQINNIINKLRHNIYIFNSIKFMLPEHTNIALYYAHVYPYLLYGNVIWGPMINTF
jgi:hypothetical protein